MKKVDMGYCEPPEYIEEEWDFLMDELYVVEKKIYDAVCEDYATIKAENKQLQEDIREAFAKCTEYEKQAKEAKDSVAGEVQKGVERHIAGLFGGWMVGEEAFFLQYEEKHKQCMTCSGAKRVRVSIDGEPHRVFCPTCQGSGEVHDRKVWKVRSKPIEQIELTAYWLDDRVKRQIEFKSDGRLFEAESEHVNLTNLDRWSYEKHTVKVLYKTKEEAQAECDKRNKAEEEGTI